MHRTGRVSMLARQQAVSSGTAAKEMFVNLKVRMIVSKDIYMSIFFNMSTLNLFRMSP